MHMIKKILAGAIMVSMAVFVGAFYTAVQAAPAQIAIDYYDCGSNVTYQGQNVRCTLKVSGSEASEVLTGATLSLRLAPEGSDNFRQEASSCTADMTKMMIMCQPLDTATVPLGQYTRYLSIMQTSYTLSLPLLPSNSLTIQQTPEALFSDVPLTHTFSAFIYSLREKGVLGGYPDNTFRPDLNISRGQLARMTAKAFFTEKGSANCGNFVDVPSTHPFYAEIMNLKCRGIVSGIGGYFYPDRAVTRGETTKIVIKSARIAVKGSDDTSFLPVRDDVVTPSDVTSTNPFYTYIQSTFSNQIVGGYPDGTFKPSNNITRGQIAKVLGMTWQKVSDSMSSSSSSVDSSMSSSVSSSTSSSTTNSSISESSVSSNDNSSVVSSSSQAQESSSQSDDNNLSSAGGSISPCLTNALAC